MDVEKKSKQELMDELDVLRRKVEDITERKQAEELLRRTEENFRRSLDDSPLGVRIVTAEGVTIYANRAILDIYSLEDLNTTPLKKRYTPESFAEYKIRREKRKQGDSAPSEYEISIVRKDGEVRYLQVFRKEVLWDGERQFQVIYQDITKRKQAEEALRECDIQFKKLSSWVPGMIYQFTKRSDGTYCVPFTTEAIKDIFGCSPQDVREDFSPIARIILPEDFDKVVDSIEYSAKHLTIWTFEYRVQNPGQSIRWILGNSTPEKLADGSITWYGFNNDITDRKQAEEALRQSEEKYREIIENMQEGYHEVDIKGNFTFFNESMRKIIGYEREELLGMNNRQYADEENTRKVYQVYNRIYRTGEPVKNFEWQIIRKDGDRRDIEVSLSLIRDTEGHPTGFRGIVRDTTERKIMEDSLRKSEEQYRSLVESTKDSIYLLDRDLRYLFANNTYLGVMGFTLQQLIGRSYSEIHPFPSDSFPGYVNHVFETGESTEFEYKSFRDNKPFLRTLSPVRGEQGKTIAITVISKDVTHLKKAENTLREYQRQLRALMGRIQAAREEERIMIAREIHDELGGALTGLKIDISYLAAILPKMRDTAKRNSFVNKLKDMTNLIDETIHTVRRMITDIRPSILDDFGLIAAIEWQAQEFQKRTGIECEFISSLEDIRFGEQHSTAVFRIFQESLTNVIRHATATKVTVSLCKEADRLILKVADDGKGITEEKISDPKSLGLLGMRERALFLGGTVNFSGEPWKGTTVSVYIPLAE